FAAARDGLCRRCRRFVTRRSAARQHDKGEACDRDRLMTAVSGEKLPERPEICPTRIVCNGKGRDSFCVQTHVFVRHFLDRWLGSWPLSRSRLTKTAASLCYPNRRSRNNLRSLPFVQRP